MIRASRPLRIVVVAPLRYPIREPFAGGLESSVHHQVRTLRERGHRVSLIATEGSDHLDQSPPEFVLPAVVFDDPAEATDTTYPDGYLERALPALERALQFVADHADDYDLVDNHSLHGVPLARADRIGVPMVSTLHTPTLPDMLAAHRSSTGPRSRFVAVSGHTAAAWAREGVEASVLPNGVDTERWGFGPGGDDLVWSGRIVPEKGLHLALEVARRAGRRLVIAGRIGDVDYFETEVAPHLGVTAHYVGELRQPELAALVGHSGCALVTPVWEEPFGLVIAEALVTGTPVVSFAVGGVPEVVAGSVGATLVPAGDLDGMARAADDLLRRVGTDADARRTVRQDAVDRFSLRARAAVLERLYSDVVASDERVPGTSAGPATDATGVGGRHRASSSLTGGLSAVRPAGTGRRVVTA